MRQLAFVSGLLLVMSCSVEPVQSVDASTAGGGGGDCPRCAGGTSGGGGQGGAPTGNGGAAGDTPAGGSGGGAGGAGGGITGAGGGGIAGHGGGGQAGNGGGGGQTCAQLETDYSTALAAARQCTPGATNQCQHLVQMSLACTGCSEYVNDVTTLDTIETEWNDQNCAAMPHACPLIACFTPASAVCASTSGTSGGPNAGASPGGNCTDVGVTAGP
jgi:hypothetical protein